MESELAARDILARNTHNNLFHLKMPSHNASQQSVLNQYHGFILNKLALVPFGQDTKLTQLYKTSLEHLIALPPQYFKNECFVEGVVEHLCIWQRNMGDYGAWPYTRAAFFSIEDKVKKNQALWQKVVYRRALLEPNKQQFLSRAMGQTFKNPALKQLVRQLEGQEDEQIKQEHRCESLRDILTADEDECWIHLQLKLNQINIEVVGEYLQEYLSRGIRSYLRRKLSPESVSEVLGGLKLRQRVVLLAGKEDSAILRWIGLIEEGYSC